MSVLAVTAITNFLLACEVFLLAGMAVAQPKARGSAAWWWAVALLMLGTSALLGGIDHGFFEVQGQTPIRRVIERTNWLVLGLLSASVLLTAARQFWPASWQRVVSAVAAGQFAVYALVVVSATSFLVVILNYAPAVLILLAGSLAGLPTGRGHWAMALGLAIIILASIVQAVGVDVFSPLDRNGLYHVVAMVGVALAAFGGRALSPRLPAPAAHLTPQRA